MRVISRAGVAVAFFVVMFMLYMLLLGAGASRAQDTTMMQETTEGTTTQPDEGCENPTLVETFTGTENQLTDPFQTTGDTFRVSFITDPQNLDDTTTPTFEFDVLDENEEPIGEGEIAFDGEDGSANVVAGPGTFSLDLGAENVEYTVTVEDCTSEDTQGGDTTDDTGGDEDTNDEDTNDDGVIDDTVPDKDLPDTGGSTALMVGGSALLLLYGGLVAWRLKSRKQ